MKALALHIILFLLAHNFCSAQNNRDTEAWKMLEEVRAQLEKKDTSGAWQKISSASEELSAGKDRTGEFYILLYTGSYRFLAKDNTSTFDNYYRALSLARELHNDTLMAEASYNIGQKHYQVGNFPTALKNLGDALRIYEHYNKEEKAAQIYRSYVYIQLALGSQEEAKVYLAKALEYYKRKNDKLQVGQLLNTYGHMYMTANDTLKAKEYFNQSLAMRIEIKDTVGIGQVYTNLGTLAYNNGKYEEAISNYRKGYEMRKQGRAPLSAIIESRIYIGKALYGNGNTKEAAKELEEGLRMAEQNDFPELERRALEVLKNVYLSLGKPEQAYAMLEKYYTLKDSLYGAEKREELLRINLGQEFEKRLYEDSLRIAEKEKHAAEVQEEKDKNQSLVRNGLIAGIVLAIGIALLLFQRNKEKRKANETITAQRDELRSRQQEIADSITYARQIQRAALPTPSSITAKLPQSFGLYLPKDVVSGDFYWYTEKNGKIWIAAADCTGHGVPGAFMSMIGIEKLNQAALELKLEKPSDVIAHANKAIKLALKQDEQGSQSRDGMDIAICAIDLERSMLEYAGANRPLWVVRDNKLIEYKATKASVAGWTSAQHKFDNTDVQLQKGDTIYLCTDGYADQFGGDKGKKLRTANFKELLVSIQHLSMNEQEKFLLDHHLKWKGKLEQVDDILVIGIRI